MFRRDAGDTWEVVLQVEVGCRAFLTCTSVRVIWTAGQFDTGSQGIICVLSVKYKIRNKK